MPTGRETAIKLILAAAAKGRLANTEELQRMIAEVIDSKDIPRHPSRNNNANFIPGDVRKAMRELAAIGEDTLHQLEQLPIDYTLPDDQYLRALASMADSKNKELVEQEVDRRYKNRIHQERFRIRHDLERKGWQKPAPRHTQTQRILLAYLLDNKIVTLDGTMLLLYPLYGNNRQAASQELSHMVREGLLERVDIGNYTASPIGRQYNPDTGEIPETPKINNRIGLLHYLDEQGPMSKAGIDNATTSASVLFNSVRDVDVELRPDGRYYITERGRAKLQKTTPDNPEKVIMEYLSTHGAIAIRRIREITGLSKETSQALKDKMLNDGVLLSAGAAGYVLADGHKPSIELQGETYVEQALNYIAYVDGGMPAHQLINVFPRMTNSQRTWLASDMRRRGYVERRDGNIVITPKGAERILYSSPVAAN